MTTSTGIKHGRLVASWTRVLARGQEGESVGCPRDPIQVEEIINRYWTWLPFSRFHYGCIAIQVSAL